MKLDPRIIEGKKPLTYFDTEEAKQFICRKCYFSDAYWAFEDIEEHKELVHTDILTGISHTGTSCFVTGDDYYQFLLPYEWIKEEEPEPKWRPYSLTEWRHDYAIGDEIVFRIKNSDTVRTFMFCGLFSDHEDDLPGKGVISLGSELFVLQNLFDRFELCENNEWRPFGVEEGEK